MSVALRAVRLVAAPPAAVWDAITDAERFEALLRARDPNLARRPPGPVGVGTRWTATIPIGGRPRRVEARLDRLEAPEAARLAADAEGIATVLDVALTPEGGGTRVAVATQARATSIGGRLALGAAGLARDRMQRALEDRLAAFAARVEAGQG